MNIFIDWIANKNNIKGRIILTLFRIATLANSKKVKFYLLIPYLIFYRLFVEWILGVELPYKLLIGKNCVIYHGHSLVINDGVVIGSNCTLRHCTTIGNKKLKNGTFSKCPILGDNIEIGSNVVIIGDISIGDNVIVGAGSVVTKSFPSNVTIVGNPAKILKYNN